MKNTKIIFMDERAGVLHYYACDDNIVDIGIKQESPVIRTTRKNSYFSIDGIPKAELTLVFDDCHLEEINLDEKSLKAIRDYNLSVKNQILQKENEKLDLQLKQKNSQLKKFGEIKNLFSEYIESDYDNFEDFVDGKYRNDCDELDFS